MKYRYNKSKYGSVKKTVDGITFHSTKEADRYCELKLLQHCGSIEQLELQKKFILIPAQYINGKCVEKSCSYYADFYYYDKLTGEYCCEDTKGYKKGTAYDLFVIKRKLMLYVHGIRVIEV